jgi:uncharacterized protein YdeI (YjbR/CyaY-like superfamily)
MPKKEIETYCPSSPTEWRKWLEQNHQSKQSVWLVCYKASTKIASVTWSEAVDEALCFGWIDSTKRTVDSERYMQYYSRRKPSSTWSKVNKDKIAYLTENNLIAKAGLDTIDTAKQNGMWSFLDDIEKLIVPKDLENALYENESSMDFYQRQSKSIKKQILYWVKSAKRTETREKRIAEITHSSAEGTLPNHF